MAHSLVRYYRTADRWARYTPSDRRRGRDLSAFYRKYRRYFGRAVLDLGCGGGVLGSVLEGSGRSYLGVDANSDMVEAARRAAVARGSRQRFVLGDARRVALPGRFHTLTLLGNALGHLTVAEFDDLLVARAPNVRPRAAFLIEYRDVVGMFWRRSWSRRFVQTHKGGRVIHRTLAVDLEKGEISIRARAASGAWTVRFHAGIWSPFILEGLMRARGWRLVVRHPAGPERIPRSRVDLWVDVYRKVPS